MLETAETKVTENKKSIFSGKFINLVTKPKRPEISIGEIIKGELVFSS